jgi:hypothetical protein
LLRVSINLPHDWNEQRRSLYRAFVSNRESQRRKKLMSPNRSRTSLPIRGRRADGISISTGEKVDLAPVDE